MWQPATKRVLKNGISALTFLSRDYKGAVRSLFPEPAKLLIPALALMCCCASPARDRMVAMTFDDLPYAAGDAHPAPSANRKILAALARHHVPTTGFVIQKRVEELGASGTEILQQWATHGFELGNHTWSHPDFNALTVDQVKSEIVRGEAGRMPRFFRFPFNHTGDTKEKHDAIAAFLAQRGYKTAPCTIDNSDWMFNRPYLLMLSRHDRAAAKLRSDYIAYTGVEIDYYSNLNKQVLGYEPPHIMLLHDNQLNADVIEDLLALFESRHYRFVSLTEAEADPAYQAPETFSTKSGMMWGYRWAAERGIKVNGKLEPEPPEWISGAAQAH